MGVATAKRRACKDCESTTRPTPYPGPRCATCNRAVKAGRRDAAHAAYVLATYNITGDQYWAIYDAQGGRCYGCRRATGLGRKRLSVDHDHKCCTGSTSCGKCVRGLLCKPCNRNVLGHLRDEVAAFHRFIDYLTDPPARRVLAGEADNANTA